MIGQTPMQQFAFAMRDLVEGGVRPMPEENSFLVLAVAVYAINLFFLARIDQ